jgi:hypothetical protein
MKHRVKYFVMTIFIIKLISGNLPNQTHLVMSKQYLHSIFAIDEDVSRLQVSMDDALGMNVIDPGQDLTEDMNVFLKTN